MLLNFKRLGTEFSIYVLD